MSVKVLSRVWEQSAATLGARLVILALADEAGDEGITWLNQASIAKKARLSEPRARQILKQLETDGEIAVCKLRRGRSTINVYRVLVGAEEEPDLERLAPFFSPEQYARVKESFTRTSCADSPEHPALSPPYIGPVREPLGKTFAVNGSEPAVSGPPKLAKIEGRNLAVDALAAVCDVDMRNRAQATRLTKALKDITVYAYEDLTPQAQELAHGERERFTAYVAEEIGRRARLYDERMRDAELTPTALAAWWHQLVKRPRGTGMTAADVLAMHDE